MCQSEKIERGKRKKKMGRYHSPKRKKERKKIPHYPWGEEGEFAHGSGSQLHAEGRKKEERMADQE